MAVMTAQPPLPLAPEDARPVGAAAAIVEDADGGRVFVHGNLVYAWDAGDAAVRRFAAVSLMRIKAATQLQVADAFAVGPATVRRWETRLADDGVAGLFAERKGPKRKSKLTADTVAAIRRLRAGGACYRGIAAAACVSVGSVRNALTDTDTEQSGAPTGLDAHFRTESQIEVEREAGTEVRAGQDCPATMSAAPVTDTRTNSRRGGPTDAETPQRNASPHARQRLLRATRRTRLPLRIDLRILHLLRHHHRVPPHPASPTRRRPQERANPTPTDLRRTPRPPRSNRDLTPITHITARFSPRRSSTADWADRGLY